MGNRSLVLAQSVKQRGVAEDDPLRGSSQARGVQNVLRAPKSSRISASDRMKTAA